MNIVVTGGAGFVGTNLIKRLIEDGHDVVSIDNYSTGSQLNHQKDCFYLTHDITKITDYSFLKPDIIFHMAAIARIQPSFKDPLKRLISKRLFFKIASILNFRTGSSIKTV